MRKTVILPGMGADARMYPEAHYGDLPGVNFVDWPAYGGETTLADVARRVIDAYRVTAGTIIGGSSLGGMVAVEIARQLCSDRVILIGSTTHVGQIHPWLMRMNGLARFARVRHLQWMARKMNRSGGNLFLSMLEKADGRFMKAMCRALPLWRGIGGYRCDIRHIHGARDKVIRPPRHGALLVPAAGHLLPMTHGDVVARFIRVHARMS